MARYHDLGLFLALAAVWGSAFAAIKAGLAYFPPVLFAALRYDVAGLLMLAYAAWAVERWRPRTAAEWRLVGIGAVPMIAGYHALLFVGEQWTTSAVAAIVVGLSPVLTTVAAGALLPDERLSLPGVVGLGLGLAGVVVLARPDPANLLGGDAVGELLVLGAAASFSLGSVLARRSPASLPVETMSAWSMVGGAVVLHAVAAALPGESLGAVAWTPAALAALAYLALGASAVGYLVYFALLDRLGPVQLNLVSYVTPVFAALTGWVLLGEVLGLLDLVGFLVIVAGFVLVKRDALRAAWRSLAGHRRGQRDA